MATRTPQNNRFNSLAKTIVLHVPHQQSWQRRRSGPDNDWNDQIWGHVEPYEHLTRNIRWTIL